MLYDSLIQSFDHDLVTLARALEPGVRLSCLFEDPADFAQVAQARGAQVAAPAYELLTRERVASCRDAGIKVLPWTVNEPEDWSRLVEWGVSGIITDYPRQLSQSLLLRR